MRENLIIHETALEANENTQEEIENATCFDRVVYTINDENVHLWRNEVKTLEGFLRIKDYDILLITPNHNRHSAAVIRRYFELKLENSRQILKDNGYSET